MRIKVEGKTITAPVELLNEISLAYTRASERFYDEGAPALAEKFCDIGLEIYEELKKRGVYNV